MNERKKDYREFACRLVILFIGLTIAHLGVTLFLLSDLGADPFNVLIQGLRQLIENAGWNLTHGTVHMAVSFLIILVLLIVDRHYVKAGTLICMFCGGPIIDFFSWLLKSLNIGGASLPVKIPVLVLGCVILAGGDRTERSGGGGDQREERNPLRRHPCRDGRAVCPGGISSGRESRHRHRHLCFPGGLRGGLLHAAVKLAGPEDPEQAGQRIMDHSSLYLLRNELRNHTFSYIFPCTFSEG